MNNQLLLRMRRGMIQQKSSIGHNLPSEYQEVEWVKTDFYATASIAFFVIDLPSNYTEICADIKLENKRQAGASCAIFGQSKGGYDYRFYGVNGNDEYVFGNNKRIEVVHQGDGLNPYDRHTYGIASDRHYIDDYIITGSFPNSNVKYGIGTGGGETGYYYPSSVKCYNTKVYNGNSIVLEAYPCYRRADRVIGLYDIIGQKFIEPNEQRGTTCGHNVY